MSQPIYTDKGQIVEALGMVKGVIRDMETNITTLGKMRDDLLAYDFQGAGAGGYEEVAKELDRRLKAYDTSIQNLDRSTENAADLIDGADKDVANLFRKLL
jgi:uncharacterized protein YukE